MKKLFGALCLLIFLVASLLHAAAQNQVLNSGELTKPIPLTSAGCAYNWTNNAPGIGLAAQGAGDIPAFTAQNATGVPITATITATPTRAWFAYMPNPKADKAVTVINHSTKAITGQVPIDRPGGVAASPDGSVVYVTNYNDGTLEVISTAINQVTRIIAVGEKPTGVAVSNDGRFVYVANQFSNTVSVISALNNYTVTATINVGSLPYGIAINPAGTRVYVANRGTATISVISTATNSVLATINIGQLHIPAGSNGLLGGIAVSADGSKVYVAYFLDGTVSVIDAASNAVVKIIDLGGLGLWPSGVAASPNRDEVYVSYDGYVGVISTATNALIQTIPINSTSGAISVTPDGEQIYLTGFGAFLGIVDRATRTVSRIRISENSDSPADFPLGNFISIGPGCQGPPVTFTITVNPTTFSASPAIGATNIVSALRTEQGSASAPAVFYVSGANLSAGIQVSPPPGFEVSTDNITFGSSVMVGIGNSPVNVPVYIRLSATASVGSYSGNVTLSSTGAGTVNVAVPASEVIEPQPAISIGILTGKISSCFGSPSTPAKTQQFIVSATNLKAVLDITAPAGFEISLSAASGYSNYISIPELNGKVTNVKIYVRSAASAPAGTMTGAVRVSSIGAAAQSVQVSGTINPMPTVNPVPGQTFINGIASATINFSGTNYNTFSWTNDKPGIGLPAVGAGNIPSFMPVNKTNAPITATITVAPVTTAMIYVVNTGANTVSAIDTATNTLVGVFPTGSMPWGVLVSPDASKIYVMNYASNDVWAISTSGGAAIAKIKVGNGPLYMSWSPDRTKIFVKNVYDGTVSVIDVATNTVIATAPEMPTFPLPTVVDGSGAIVLYYVYDNNNIAMMGLPGKNDIGSRIKVGQNPQGLTVSPDGNSLYVANRGSNDVSVLSTATNTVVTTIPVGLSPVRIVVSSDSFVAYVANSGSNTISVIDAISNKVTSTITVGSKPLEMYMSTDDKWLYVANSGSNNISVINTATLTVVATILVGKAPVGISLSPDGKWAYAGDSGSNTISVISTATNTVVATIPVNAQPGIPVASADGRFVFVEMADKSVTVISTATNSVVISIPVQPDANNLPAKPSSQILSPDGTLRYSTGNGLVSITNIATGKLVRTIRVGKGPVSPSLSPDGNKLYVVNQDDGTISVINTVNYEVLATIPAGNYPTESTLSEGAGCIGDPITFTITIVPTPVITANAIIRALTTDVGKPSAAASFTVSGAYLLEGILVSPPPGFEVSNDGISFSPTVTVGGAGTINAATVYVRIAASTAIGLYAGKIVLSSKYAANVDITIEESEVEAVSPTIIPGLITGIINSCPGTASAAPFIQQFKFTGSLLSSSIVIKAPVGFEVSLAPGSGYTSSISVAPVNSKVRSTSVYVRSSATAPSGSISGDVLLSSAGAPSQLVTVSGIINTLPVVNAVASQTVPGGTSTAPVNFFGTGNTFYWQNDLPGIGLAANGSGDIASFKAVNKGKSVLTATITVTPMFAGFAYITNSKGSVSVMNTGSNQVVASIKVDLSPYAVSISPDGSKVYIANNGSDKVSVISTATNKIVSTITVGSYPSGLVVSPDGKQVYASNGGSNTVSVISTETDTEITKITVGLNPQAIAVSPDGSKIYVANRTSGSVSVLNSSTNTVSTTIPIGLGPEGLCLSPDGKILYVTSYNKLLSVVNTETNTVLNTIAVGLYPKGIAVSPDGQMLYVANSNSGNVSVINTATNTVMATVTTGAEPTSISLSLDGSMVYVTNAGSGTVSVINAKTNKLASTVTVGGTPVSVGNFITKGLNCAGDPAAFKIIVNPEGPAITATGTLSPLSTVYGIPSASISFSMSGISMAAGILVTPPPGFEVSLDDITFTGTVIGGAPGIISPVKVYVRLAATTAVGNYSGDIVLSSTGAINVNVPVGPGKVDPASLTIAADDKTSSLGNVLPVFTATYTGFVNKEGPGQLTALPIFSSTGNRLSSPGKYLITVSGAASANYIITYQTGVLTIINPQNLFIPNVFTPNGDGINDTWRIEELAYYPDCAVSLFDRYGAKVYSSRGYSVPWDGTYNSSKLPSGIYYYIIDLKNGSKQFSGSVTILR